MPCRMYPHMSRVADGVVCNDYVRIQLYIYPSVYLSRFLYISGINKLEQIIDLKYT